MDERQMVDAIGNLTGVVTALEMQMQAVLAAASKAGMDPADVRRAIDAMPEPAMPSAPITGPWPAFSDASKRLLCSGTEQVEARKPVLVRLVEVMQRLEAACRRRLRSPRTGAKPSPPERDRAVRGSRAPWRACSAPARIAAAGAARLLGLLVRGRLLLLDLAGDRRAERDAAHHHALRHLEGGEVDPGRRAPWPRPARAGSSGCWRRCGGGRVAACTTSLNASA